jgi:hypothetical protein
MSHAYWFKPKRFGYGATPSSWEGWAVVAAYALLIWASVTVMAMHQGSDSIFVAMIAVMLAATVALFAICKKKTDGSWGWNAGAKPNSGKND